MKHVNGVTEATFRVEVLESANPVLVDFWATNCQPCEVVDPIVEEFAAAHTGTLKVVRVLCNTSEALARGLGISSAPTLAMFREGREVGRFEVQSIVQRLLDAHGEAEARVIQSLEVEVRSAMERLVSDGVAATPGS